MKKLTPILKNKFFVVGFLFVIWIVFFDTNRLISISRYKKELKEVRNERDYYLEQIENNKELLETYKSDSKAIENFAREKYLMKKDNEEIFLIVKED